jgi:hypothetical protein
VAGPRARLLPAGVQRPGELPGPWRAWLVMTADPLPVSRARARVRPRPRVRQPPAVPGVPFAAAPTTRVRRAAGACVRRSASASPRLPLGVRCRRSAVHPTRMPDHPGDCRVAEQKKLPPHNSYTLLPLSADPDSSTARMQGPATASLVGAARRCVRPRGGLSAGPTPPRQREPGSARAAAGGPRGMLPPRVADPLGRTRGIPLAPRRQPRPLRPPRVPSSTMSPTPPRKSDPAQPSASAGRQRPAPTRF